MNPFLIAGAIVIAMAGAYCMIDLVFSMRMRERKNELAKLEYELSFAKKLNQEERDSHAKNSEHVLDVQK